MKDYENYLLKEKIPFKELTDLDNFNYEIKKDDINSDNQNLITILQIQVIVMKKII